MRAIYSALIFSSFLYLASCQDATTADAQHNINKELQVDDYEQKLNATAGAQLVDVRTPGEYAEGHLKNSVNIDYNSDAFADKIARLDKQKPVFVYCLSGGRSSMAAEQMHNMGFSEVYNMKGGIMKWNRAGKPTVNGGESKKATGMSMDDFNKQVSKNGYVMVDYNAQWCAPCKKIAPMLDKVVSEKKGKLDLLKIDADENKELLNEKGIEGIPYLELYRDGKLVWTHSGLIDEATLLKETKL
ncbi:MAG: hypothetical protein BGO69_15665 [Bacteroidetes bacterium 46-16]|nr:MAG: hypothetical protein BGO69_15665 [Bacteroidetes bacterium 46-16]